MYRNKDEQNEAIQNLLYKSRLERESKWMADPKEVWWNEIKSNGNQRRTDR